MTRPLNFADLQAAFTAIQNEPPLGPEPEVVSPAEYEWRKAHPCHDHMDYVFVRNPQAKGITFTEYGQPLFTMTREEWEATLTGDRKLERGAAHACEVKVKSQ